MGPDRTYYPSVAQSRNLGFGETQVRAAPLCRTDLRLLRRHLFRHAKFHGPRYLAAASARQRSVTERFARSSRSDRAPRQSARPVQQLARRQSQAAYRCSCRDLQPECRTATRPRSQPQRPRGLPPSRFRPCQPTGTAAGWPVGSNPTVAVTRMLPTVISCVSARRRFGKRLRIMGTLKLDRVERGQSGADTSQQRQQTSCKY